jgi:hypothetical protein
MNSSIRRKRTEDILKEVNDKKEEEKKKEAGASLMSRAMRKKILTPTT